ncbi:MAG: hypothetical protein HYT98_01360 [Candidatus Sungbacteria bacterium]|nr:hypothetical protein [Candidatus Sungbacteria bacterium]
MRLFSFQFLNKKVFWLALGGAFFVSAFYGLPHILISRNLATEGKAYHPVTFFSDMDEAQIYAPQVREVAEGINSFGDPALREHADGPSVRAPLGASVLGFAARLIGFENAWILADFIFPPIIFLIIFSVLVFLSGDSTLSLLLGAIFIFSRDLASLFPFSLFYQFKSFAAYFKPWIAHPVVTHLPLDRLFTPEWTFIPLGVFFLLWLMAIKKKMPFLFIGTGIAYGALFYSYPFDWVSVTVILGMAAVLFFLRREYRMAMFQTAVLVIGFVIAIPFFISFFELRQFAHYAELIGRTGLEVGREIRWLLWPHFLVWLAAAISAFRRLEIAAASIFLGALTVMNIQVITGYVPQPEHFLRYPLALALFIAYILLVPHLWNKFMGVKFQRFGYTFLVLIFLLMVTRNIQLQFAYAKENVARFTLDSSTENSFVWMQANIPDDAVVLSPSVVTNTHLLIFTSAKVFVPPTGVITSASDREMLERYVIAAKIFGMGDQWIRGRFSRSFLETRSHEDDLRGIEDGIALHLFHYGLYSREPNTYFGRGGFRDFSDVETSVAEILESWRISSETLLQKYAFEYIYAGLMEKTSFSFSVGDMEKNGLCLHEIYNQENVSIYERCGK